jgi:hypothetical protein
MPDIIRGCVAPQKSKELEGLFSEFLAQIGRALPQFVHRRRYQADDGSEQFAAVGAFRNAVNSSAEYVPVLTKG